MSNSQPKRDADNPDQQLAPSKSSVAGVELISLADVEPEQVEWLWPDRIPLGKLTTLAGDPGLGKSFLTLDIAARVSEGRSWPDETANERGEVILLSAEDDLADTILPRLDAAGADVKRILALGDIPDSGQRAGESKSRMFSLQRDVPRLRAAIKKRPDCRLVVIDPITAYLDGTDSHNNADLRGLLAPLAELAAECRVAVLVVSHLNKSSTQPAMYRTIGSIAFVATARSALLVAKDKRDPTGRTRYMLPLKNNLGRMETSLPFVLESPPGDGNMPVVAWGTPMTLDVEEMLSPDNPKKKTGGKLEEAKNWLRGVLAMGQVPADTVKRCAKEAGIATRTLDRAKQVLKVKAEKEGFGDEGPWIWSLPEKGTSPTPGSETLAPFGTDGALCSNLEENAFSEGTEPTKERQKPKGRQASGGGGESDQPVSDFNPDDVNALLAQAAEDEAREPDF